MEPLSESERLDAHHIPDSAGDKCVRGHCPWSMTTNDASGRPIHDPNGSSPEEDVATWMARHVPDGMSFVFYHHLASFGPTTRPHCTVDELVARVATQPPLMAVTVRAWGTGEQHMWGRVEFDVTADTIELLLDPTTGRRYS
jgi:hypothetical protein